MISLTIPRAPFRLGGAWSFVLALLLPLVPGGVIGSLALLVWMAWRGRQAEALLCTILVATLNPALFNAGGMTLGRWGVLLTALLVSWPGLRMRALWPNFFLAILGLYIVWNAVVISSVPSLSLFKGGLFVVVLWVLFNSRFFDWAGFQRRLATIIPLYTLITLPLLAVPSIGMQLNNLGFQGLTQHPQLFGILCAAFAVWMGNQTLTARLHAPRWVGYTTTAALLGLILASQARTALAAALVGLFAAWLISLFSARQRQPVRNLLLAGIVGVAGATLYAQTDVLSDFLFKERYGGVRELDFSSRAALIGASQQNFQDNPLTGIGFGVPSTADDAAYTTLPVLDLPISANTEKGTWITAGLEELGLAGFSLLVLFLGALAVYTVRVQPGALPMLLLILVSNLGEMTMFSMGALGLVLWLLFFSDLHND